MDVGSSSRTFELNCSVCNGSYDVSRHFGCDSCQACASFFRRTVSLKIQYICNKEKRCPTSHNFRINCRSCRYDKCIEKGMKIEHVQPRRNLTKIPKYIQQYRDATNCDTILREYAISSLSKLKLEKTPSTCSSSATTSHSSSASPSLPEISDSDSESSRYSTMLNISCEDLLQFYYEQTSFSLNERRDLNYEIGETASQMCKICPGADLLDSEELEILFRYSFFACEVMDSAWAKLEFPNSRSIKNLESTSNESILKNVEQDLYEILKILSLDVVEYSALKAMCIWKLGMCDFTVSMKIIAQEQYSSLFPALKNYYEKTLEKDKMFAITRISDITLVLGNIFKVYCEMIVTFKKEDIVLISNIGDLDCSQQNSIKLKRED